MRMRINFQEVVEFRILLGYLRVIMTSQRVLYCVQGQGTSTCRRRMSDFDAALTYALERIGRPSVQLKPQQRAYIQADTPTLPLLSLVRFMGPLEGKSVE